MFIQSDDLIVTVLFFIIQQMKRKLDDVSKKLEILDERLRNNGVSSAEILPIALILMNYS